LKSEDLNENEENLRQSLSLKLTLLEDNILKDIEQQINNQELILSENTDMQKIYN